MRKRTLQNGFTNLDKINLKLINYLRQAKNVIQCIYTLKIKKFFIYNSDIFLKKYKG